MIDANDQSIKVKNMVKKATQRKYQNTETSIEDVTVKTNARESSTGFWKINQYR